MNELKVGDICITVNSQVPALNDGLLVQIVAVDPAMLGGDHPYCIVRLDGQPFPAARVPDTGEVDFFQDYEIWSVARYLRKLPPESGPPGAGEAAIGHLPAVVSSPAGQEA